MLVGMRRCRDARIRLRNDVAVVFVPAVAPAKKKAPGDARGPRLHLQCEDEAVEALHPWLWNAAGAVFVPGCRLCRPQPGPRGGS